MNVPGQDLINRLTDNEGRFDIFLNQLGTYLTRNGVSVETLPSLMTRLGASWGANVASQATITPTGVIFHVTGNNTISTINLPWVGFKDSIRIIPDGLFTTNTSGNIAIASTAVIGKTLTLTYDENTSKWYPSY